MGYNKNTIRYVGFYSTANVKTEICVIALYSTSDNERCIHVAQPMDPSSAKSWEPIRMLERTTNSQFSTTIETIRWTGIFPSMPLTECLYRTSREPTPKNMKVHLYWWLIRRKNLRINTGPWCNRDVDDTSYHRFIPRLSECMCAPKSLPTKAKSWLMKDEVSSENSQ